MQQELIAAVFITPLHTTLRLYGQDRQPIGETVRRIPTISKDPKIHLVHITYALIDLRKTFAPDGKITQITVAIAGQVRHGAVIHAGRLHHWKNVRIDKQLEKAFKGAKVVVGNDAEARARWEAANNPAVAGATFMALYWGEGIGGAYCDPIGKIHPLEPGHVRVEGLSTDELLRCHCGWLGCLDAHAGGARVGLDLSTSGSRWLSVQAATDYADLIAGVVARLIIRDKRPSDFFIVGGQRLKLHENLGKGNPTLSQLLQKQLDLRISNRLMRPQLVQSKLWYAPAETALTLLDNSLVGAR